MNNERDDIGDVNDLFGDPKPSAGRTPPRPVPDAIPLDGYDVVGGQDDDDELVPPPRVTVEPPRAAKPKKPPVEQSPQYFDEDDDEPAPTRDAGGVDEIWTRWGEWGPTAILLGVALAAVLALTYILGNTIGFGTGFLTLVLGFVLLIILSYPIAITLERPVRMTPEQAVKDFYGAASHAFPHYRRMWLLLSNDGKTSRHFDSLATFRQYWKQTIGSVQGAAGKKGAVTFTVLDFKSEKSAGEKHLETEYRVEARVGGPDGPSAGQVSMATWVTRGPDKMWYLDDGTFDPSSKKGQSTKRR